MKPEDEHDSLGVRLEELLPDLRSYVRLRCGALVRAQESSSDIVQSALREAWQGLGVEDLPRERVRLKALLFHIAEHKIVNRARYWQRDKRDVRRQEELPSSEVGLLQSYAGLASPSGALNSLEEVARIEAAFDRLPERYRDVILSARFLGMSPTELGEKFELSPHAARTLLSRACARLASLLDESEAE